MNFNLLISKDGIRGLIYKMFYLLSAFVSWWRKRIKKGWEIRVTSPQGTKGIKMEKG